MAELNLRREVLVASRIKEFEKEILELCEDKYYADSWEQSSRISDRIKILEDKKEVLWNYLTGNKCDKRALLKILHEWIHIKRKSNHSIIMEPLKCSNLECRMNCEGGCIKISSTINRFECKIPEVDGCFDEVY